MNPTRMLVAAFAASMITACATTPKGFTDAQINDFRNRGLSVESISGAKSVKVSTKGGAVAAGVIGAVAGAAVGSNPGEVSAKGLQEAQELGAATGALVAVGVDAALAQTRGIAAPVSGFAAALAREQEERSIPVGVGAYQVSVNQRRWELHFDSLFGKDNYVLSYELRMKVKDTAGKSVLTTTCSGVSEKAALDVWRADDSSKVKAAALQYADRCAKHLLGEMGLGAPPSSPRKPSREVDGRDSLSAAIYPEATSYYFDIPAANNPVSNLIIRAAAEQATWVKELADLMVIGSRKPIYLVVGSANDGVARAAVAKATSPQI